MNVLASSGLVIFVTSAFASTFVYFNNRKKQTNIAWGLFCLSVSLWGLGLFFGFITDSKLVSLFWGRFLNLSAVFIPIFFLHFVFAFVGLTRTRKSILTVFYFITLIYFLFSISFPHLFISDVVPRFSFQYYPEAGVLFYFFPLMYTTIVLTGIIYLFYAYKGAGGRKHNQISYLFWGMAIGFAGGATTFPYVFNINIYPFGTWGVIVYVITVTYAIVKHRLMDIEVIIRKGLIYSVVIAIFTGLYLSAVYLATRLFENVLGIGSIGIGAGLVFLFALLFQPLKDKVNQVIDRFFFKSEYEYRVALKEISKSISEAKDLGELSELVSSEIVDVFKVKHAKIWKVE